MIKLFETFNYQPFKLFIKKLEILFKELIKAPSLNLKSNPNWSVTDYYKVVKTGPNIQINDNRGFVFFSVRIVTGYEFHSSPTRIKSTQNNKEVKDFYLLDKYIDSKLKEFIKTTNVSTYDPDQYIEFSTKDITKDIADKLEFSKEDYDMLKDQKRFGL